MKLRDYGYVYGANYELEMVYTRGGMAHYWDKKSGNHLMTRDYEVYGFRIPYSSFDLIRSDFAPIPITWADVNHLLTNGVDVEGNRLIMDEEKTKSMMFYGLPEVSDGTILYNRYTHKTIVSGKDSDTVIKRMNRRSRC